MNAMLAHTSVLPAVLSTTARAPRQPGLARRHSIGGFNPGPYALDRFNVLLERLGREQGPIDCDQLATAARELCGCSTTLAAAAIGVRMRRAGSGGQGGWQDAGVGKNGVHGTLRTWAPVWCGASVAPGRRCSHEVDASL